MGKKETFLILLLLFVADAIVFSVLPCLVDYFWYVQGVLAAFIFSYHLWGRVPKNQIKYFTPLVSGILLMILSQFLMKTKNFILGSLGFFLTFFGIALLLFGFYYLKKVKLK